MAKRIPAQVRHVAERLHQHRFEAFLVGGAVRDFLLSRTPKDWDIATNALPDNIQEIFRKSIPTGAKFGTVTVFENRFPIQVTTYRVETQYKDRRRPFNVEFVSDLQTDLSRRDFTINAMAYDFQTKKVIDPFEGKKDLHRKLLRTVGSAKKRFSEDALRPLRAGRFIAQLAFRPDPALTQGAKQTAKLIRHVSAERIRDELSKMLLASKPSIGILWLEKTGLLKMILPELLKGKGMKQGGWHQYDIYQHTLKTVDFAKPDLLLRLAALLHDIGKPITRTRGEDRYHFYRHEKVGAEMAKGVLRRLRFSNQLIEDVCALILHHLFEDDPISKSAPAVRRLIRRVGEGRLDALIDLRKADIKACGKGRKIPRALETVRKKARAIARERHALKIKDLKITGHDVMSVLHVPPGPKVGETLSQLLEEVLANPKVNQRSILLKKLKDSC